VGPGRGRARFDHRGGGDGGVGDRNVIGVSLLDKVVEHTPTVSKEWVDAMMPGRCCNACVT
jgi:hypothetical protein